MSSHWLCAVPRALGACRVGLSSASLVALVGLATASGCGVSMSSEPSGVGSASGSNGSASDSDSGVLTDAASSCHPSDVQTYVPSGTYQAAADPSDACLGTAGAEPLYAAFYDYCLGPNKSKAACSTFEQDAASAACASCVLTPFMAARLGPILDYGGFVGGNVPGCIEVTAPPPDNLMCASAVQALSDCELAACQVNCPVSDSASLAAREQCANTADATGCKAYYDPAKSKCSSVGSDGGLATACTNTVFKDFYDAVVPLFCARSTPDAGAAADAGPPTMDAAAGDGSGLPPERDGAAADAGVVVVDAAHD